MEISELKIFLAVADEQGFTAASKKLHCVQPNVTARVKKLEDELGVPLFFRDSRKVILTAYGKQLYDYARRIVRLSQEAAKTLQADRPTGPLAIGVTQTVAAAYLPDILRVYHARYPDVDLMVKPLYGKEIPALLGHTLDCGLLEIPVYHPELMTESSWTQKLVMVMAPGYSIDKKGVTALVFSSSCPYRNAMLNEFKHQGIVIERQMKLLHVDTILACAIGGVGVAVLPDRLVTREHIAPYVQVSELYTEERVTINLIRYTESLRTPQSLAFFEVVKEVMDSYFEKPTNAQCIKMIG